MTASYFFHFDLFCVLVSKNVFFLLYPGILPFSFLGSSLLLAGGAHSGGMGLVTPSSEWIIEEAEKWSLDCDLLACMRAASLILVKGAERSEKGLLGAQAFAGAYL